MSAGPRFSLSSIVFPQKPA